MKKDKTLTIFVVEFNDSYLALERVAQLFRRQRSEIRHLTFAKGTNPAVCLTIDADVEDDQSTYRLEKCLLKLVNVVSVRVHAIDKSTTARDG